MLDIFRWYIGKTKSQSGSAYIMTLILLMVVSVMVAAFLTTSQATTSIAQRQLDQKQAFWAAEAGVEHLKSFSFHPGGSSDKKMKSIYLNNGGNYSVINSSTGEFIEYDGGKVFLNNNQGERITFSSTGQYKNNTATIAIDLQDFGFFKAGGKTFQFETEDKDSLDDRGGTDLYENNLVEFGAELRSWEEIKNYAENINSFEENDIEGEIRIIDVSNDDFHIEGKHKFKDSLIIFGGEGEVKFSGASAMTIENSLFLVYEEIENFVAGTGNINNWDSEPSLEDLLESISQEFVLYNWRTL